MRPSFSSKDLGAKSFERGSRLFRARNFYRAEKEYQRSLNLRTANLGDDHEETLDSKYWLARSLYKQEKYKEAEVRFRQSIFGREKVLGQDHKRTLTTKYWLAHTLCYQMEYEEAEAYFRETVAGQEKVLGDNCKETLDSKHWLASSLYCQDKYEEAEAYFRETVVGQEKVLGQDHDETLDSKYWLARSLYFQDKCEEAEVYFQQTVVGREKVLGQEHNETLDSKHWLAHSLYCQDKYEEAEAYFRETVVGRAKVLGQDHERTQDSKKWLALCREKQHIKIGSNILQPDVIGGRTSGIMFASEDPQSRALSRALPPTELARGSLQHLAQYIDEFFIRGPEGLAYKDSDVFALSRLLAHQHLEWSRAPRMYIVLRTINCLHLLDDFIASGFTDYWFPVTATNLPAILTLNQKSDFVNTQYLVLTRTLDLEKGAEGQHCYFNQDEVLPLEKQRILGRGAFGQVDEVLSLISYQKYARKRVLRKTVLRGQKPEHLKLFIAEIEILKHLQHRHVVQFVGSYSDTKYLGLLMRPVAEMDLSAYLTRPDISSRLGELRTFFGCLAVALDFLHAQSVRHKDIKPQNILIDHGNILFTDFGLSHDFSDDQVSTTVSMVNGMTPRYCAPEVALYEPRNKSSDIWSLGIVYLEMLVTLKGLTPEHMEKYFAEHGTKERWVRTNREGFIGFLEHLSTVGDRGDNRVIHWIGDMLQETPAKRPHASLLVATINDTSKEVYESKGFCGICCSRDVENDGFSDFSD